MKDKFLYPSLLFATILLVVANTVSMHFLSYATPNPSDTLYIVSQWQFVSIMWEVLQEAFVLPLVFFIGHYWHKKDITARIVVTYSIVITVVFCAVIVLLVCMPLFVDDIGVVKNVSIYHNTIRYLRIKTIASAFAILSTLSITLIRSAVMIWRIVIIAVIRIILDIGLKVLLFYNNTLDVDTAIYYVAMSELGLEICIWIIATLIFFFHNQYHGTIGKLYKLYTYKLVFYNLMKQYGKTIWGSGGDSLVRNIAYFVMILKMLNGIDESEAINGYYLSMMLLWGYMLVPVVAVAEYAKIRIGHHSNNAQKIKDTIVYAFKILIVFMFVCIVLSPLIPQFLSWLNPDVTSQRYAIQSLLYLAIPYILLSFNIVIDAIFYGTGKTQYMFYQAIITNIVVFGIAYILWKLGIWIPTFTSILLLFGIGIVVDSICTVFYAWRVFVRIKNT